MDIDNIIKTYYPRPYTNTYNKVFTEKDDMCIDFPSNFTSKSAFPFNNTDKELIVAILNDKTKLRVSFDAGYLEYDKESSTVKLHTEDGSFNFLSIRGWGNLIGTGGHNLKVEEAKAIQDAFGEWVVDKLTTKP